MQQMNAQRPDRIKRDPAPSRAAYRIHRLWLTPLFRALLRVGLPSFTVIMLIGLYVSDAENRERMNNIAREFRAAIETRDEFMVKLMAIDGATVPVAADIREVLSQDFPVSSFDLDLEAMKAQVETLDAVKSAQLRIQSGGVLQILVMERIPAIVWRNNQGTVLLDAAGVLVGPVETRMDRADLPLVAGEGAQDHIPEALDLLQAAAPIMDRVKGLVRIGERRWDIVLDRNQRILLPADDPILAMARIITLDDAQDMLARDLSVVDMRLGYRPTIRLQHDAADGLRRIRVSEIGVTQE
ncbi:cell division protein FtsQ/DivIB [Parasulfitobacter algicola]|uniref:Cell division protein FtsQ n=1 Tax=Parasulfitobacter algicola TaxID=2614809 RepID=A0ABX2IMR6_9RHOB|nr:cell division protein FtsQ/DivIB [Sulfitobacter algicola]NSX54177.1 cell division protein FtsQ [Sulfitobacter algicola]